MVLFNLFPQAGKVQVVPSRKIISIWFFPGARYPLEAGTFRFSAQRMIAADYEKSIMG